MKCLFELDPEVGVLNKTTIKNLRDKMEIPKELKEREINSYKGSYYYPKEIPRNQKNNFPFKIQKSNMYQINNTNSLNFLRYNKHLSGTKKEFTLLCSFNPVKEFSMNSASMQYYLNKGKLGFEILLYQGSRQVNCFFSRVTNKVLLRAENIGTYTTNGCGIMRKSMSIKDLAVKLNWLIEHKFRFRMIHERGAYNSIILTYVIRKYVDYSLMNNSSFFFEGNSSDFHFFISFTNQKKLVCYQKLRNITRFNIYEIESENIKKISTFQIEEDCTVNKEASEDIELIVVDFIYKIEFYHITENGRIELIYVYGKWREYSVNVNPRNEMIIILRRDDVVSISERVLGNGGGFGSGEHNGNCNYYLSKFKI